MAAEAGLIDPQPEKETPSEKQAPAENSTEADVAMMETDSEENEGTGEVEAPAEAQNVGLCGGSMVYKKMGLKGGSKFRLGLFGGSPIGPPVRPFTYRGGLFGGSKDTTEENNQEAPVTTEEGGVAQASVNGSLKKPEEEGETDDIKMEYEENSEKTDTSPQKSEHESGNSNLHGRNSTDNLKKDETGDALSALASAALDHSKDFQTDNTEITIKEEKDIWYTVGFIKGNSVDVQHYYDYEEDSSQFTIDNLPDLSHFTRINLDPGTAYKFRVAAINSVGRGEWSEVCSSYYK